jgi:hypothetical protein
MTDFMAFQAKESVVKTMLRAMKTTEINSKEIF